MDSFAKLLFAVSEDAIRTKPGMSAEEYIDKYNPYEIKVRRQKQLGGYDVTLPITAVQAADNPERAAYLLQRTLDSLSEKEIMAVCLPTSIPYGGGAKPYHADGARLLPFFMGELLSKLLRHTRIENARVLILGGDGKDRRGGELIRGLIWRLPERVNYLLALAPYETYAEDAEEIFNETGLEIGFLEHNKLNITDADAVICCMTERMSFEYSLRRGAAYYDNGTPNLNAVLAKRQDVYSADGCELWYRGEAYSPQEFEALLFLRSRAFRLLAGKGFEPSVANYVAGELRSMGVRVRSLRLMGRKI